MDFTSFGGIKKARLRKDGLVNGSLCLWLQDTGGTSTCTLLPDIPAVSYGDTDPLRGQVSGIKYSIVGPTVGSLSVLRNTIYNQVTNEQEFVWVKRKV
jgi:hypothetical protein